MTEAGANPNSRRLAPEVRARLIQLAKERKLELPARLTRSSEDENGGIVTRTVYKLGGTPTNPKVVPVTIKTGITDGSATEIIEGLNEGDAIITSAYQPGATGATAGNASTPNPFGGGGRR